MPGEHARVPASASKKWLNCTRSVEMESRIPQENTQYADEGTRAHALGEAKLRYALAETTRVQYHKAIEGIEIDPDMDRYTDDYRDYVMERYAEAAAPDGDAVLHLEKRLDLRDWIPEGFGTGDAVIVTDGTAEIIDLKYGKGVRVSAENNSQLRLYALGLLAAFDWLYTITEVRMTIYQPRIDNISSEVMSVMDLIEWGEWVRKRARKAYDGIGICEAGKHCEDGFCRARPICRAYKEYKTELAVMAFAKPQTLTEEEIAEVLDQTKGLISWADSIKAYALQQALKGVHYPGYKVVEGRSIRKYTDTDRAADRLMAAGYGEEYIFKPKELIGISAMEKLLGKAKFNELLKDFVEKPPGAPTLAPSEDRRPEWNGAASDFKDYIEKE